MFYKQHACADCNRLWQTTGSLWWCLFRVLMCHMRRNCIYCICKTWHNCALQQCVSLVRGTVLNNILMWWKDRCEPSSQYFNYFVPVTISQSIITLINPNMCDNTLLPISWAPPTQILCVTTGAGICGGLLWPPWLLTACNKKQGISWLAKWLLIYEEGICRWIKCCRIWCCVIGWVVRNRSAFIFTTK